MSFQRFIGTKYLGDGVAVSSTDDPYLFRIWTSEDKQIFLDMDMIEGLARMVGILREDDGEGEVKYG